MNTVSVVIPCFNAERWIGHALKSVSEQNSSDLEVVVVDDGSTDHSVEIIQRSFPDVTVVRTTNGGPSRARNIGTHRARGAFIQYLDADDVLAPGKIGAHVHALEQTGADIAYGDWTELRQRSDGSYAPGRESKRRLPPDAATAVLTDFWCPPAAYLFRRSIVERIGGWDEQQWLIEDVRLVLMCALHGASFTYVPGVSALYRSHSHGSLSQSDPVAFQRGCLRNAATVEAWWLRNGGLNPMQKQALLRAYSHVARASFGCDESAFGAAYAALQRLDPEYVPAGPWHFTLMSRLVGYRFAESVALRYRRARRTLSARVPIGSQ